MRHLIYVLLFSISTQITIIQAGKCEDQVKEKRKSHIKAANMVHSGFKKLADMKAQDVKGGDKETWCLGKFEFWSEQIAYACGKCSKEGAQKVVQKRKKTFEKHFSKDGKCSKFDADVKRLSCDGKEGGEGEKNDESAESSSPLTPIVLLAILAVGAYLAYHCCCKSKSDSESRSTKKRSSRKSTKSRMKSRVSRGGKGKGKSLISARYKSKYSLGGRGKSLASFKTMTSWKTTTGDESSMAFASTKSILPRDALWTKQPMRTKSVLALMENGEKSNAGGISFD